MPALRELAIAYSIIIALAAIWAFYVDVRLVHSVREHLLPDLVLALITLPASLSLGPLYETWPTFFSRPLVQPAWTAFCGAAQAGVLFLVAALISRRMRRAS